MSTLPVRPAGGNLGVDPPSRRAFLLAAPAAAVATVAGGTTTEASRRGEAKSPVAPPETSRGDTRDEPPPSPALVDLHDIIDGLSELQERLDVWLATIDDRDDAGDVLEVLDPGSRRDLETVEHTIRIMLSCFRSVGPFISDRYLCALSAQIDAESAARRAERGGAK